MPMDATRLWAKSKREDEPERPSMLLPRHLEDVYEAALRVLDATGDDQLRALGLDTNPDHERFRRCVLLAAAIHDLGKANDHFQGMVRGTRNAQQNPQGVRHEWVTVLMLKELREWLLPAVGGGATDFAFVEWAVAGHHPAHDHTSPPRTCPPGAGAEIRLLADHGECQAIPRWLKTKFRLNGEPPKPTNLMRNLVGGANVYEELSEWAKAARRTWEELTPNERRFVAAVKSCLIAADVAGSALPPRIADGALRWQWITQSFSEKPSVADLRAVVEKRLAGGQPRAFQSQVATSTQPVTYIKAGCGSGKTLAAYMWARDRCPSRRLFFCYPTTGTATEGFRDYLHEPDVRADLFHSRRDVDFEIILTTGRDAKDADRDAAIRIESLDAWSTPIVACTVDTVLGIVQNNKRGLFAWPALAQSAFVFDEIHAYDDRLFGALLRFLRDLPGLPCLLMTASLPAPREEALRETLKQFRNLDLNPIPGPKDLEELPRYHKATAENIDPLAHAKKTLDAGGKVLWVCNTVRRVMEAATPAMAEGMKPLIYHSRFKYEDRVNRHKDIIEAFKVDGAALAICSQVAEVSLDLSADLLVTDLAPVPALIQRLGRLNRRARNKGEATKPFVVVEPDSHLPYTPAELDTAKKWLEELPDADIAQCHLAAMWEQSADNPPELVSSAWLDGGPTTTVAELREASLGITVLMREDVQRVQNDRKQLGRYVLPMPPPPRALDWRRWNKERGLPIAAPGSINYDRMRGAEWAR